MESYDTIAAMAVDEYVEKKSRFIGAAAPAADEAAARAFLEERRALHREASHNCYAYILRENNIARYSDDGEPGGTAGLPILEVLRREGFSNIILVVTRYFGGTLLGAGGLLRAYAHTAKMAVDAAKRVTMCPCALFLLETDYALYERVRLLLEEYGAVILDTGFASDITLSVRMRRDNAAPFSAALTGLSNGRLAVVPTGEEFAPV